MTVLDDTEFEPNETFEVRLSDPLIGGMTDLSRFTIADGVGVGVIINNDAILVAGAGSELGASRQPM